MAPLLEYFRSTFPKPRGKNWGADRLSAAKAAIAEPARLAQLFEESVRMVEREYRNYQPFHPEAHTFGMRGKTTTAHGDELRATVDVAARLAKREVWKVEGNWQLDFHYLDREIPLARAKPKSKQDPGPLLKVDLFLAANDDRTPILSEIKVRKDECAFYALIQLLTQAAYAVTLSQRERLVLFGSRSDFVLLEAIPGELAWLDLYVLLVEPPVGYPYDDLRVIAIELSHKLIADSSLASRIGCIAWITGTDQPNRELAFEAVAVAASSLRRPGRHRFPV